MLFAAEQGAQRIEAVSYDNSVCLWGELSEVQEPGLPGEEDALHNIEVLHEHVTLRLRAQVAHGVADAQLDGPLQSGRCGLQGNAATSRPLGQPLPRPWTPGHLRSTCHRGPPASGQLLSPHNHPARKWPGRDSNTASCGPKAHF